MIPGGGLREGGREEDWRGKGGNQAVSLFHLRMKGEYDLEYQMDIGNTSLIEDNSVLFLCQIFWRK